MVKFSLEEIKEMCSEEEHNALGMLIFDNCSLEQKQEVISMFLQERKKNLTTTST